jgi:NADH-quinone oxidoreductase subunit G
MAYRGPKFIMKEVGESNPAFSGATYDAMELGGYRLTEVGAVA